MARQTLIRPPRHAAPDVKIRERDDLEFCKQVVRDEDHHRSWWERVFLKEDPERVKKCAEETVRPNRRKK